MKIQDFFSLLQEASVVDGDLLSWVSSLSLALSVTIFSAKDVNGVSDALSYSLQMLLPIFQDLENSHLCAIQHNMKMRRFYFH